jgi:putative hydrolase of HD superfamily
MIGNVKLTEELEFVRDLDALRDVERQNPLADNQRRERVAEHSWHLAAAAILLLDYVETDIDLGRAVLLAVVHDVVEMYVGDTFAFGDTSDQFSREHQAMDRLVEASGSPGVRRLVEFWREYEDQRSDEAKFVKGLDALLPIMQNYSNPDHSSWRQHGVPADKVLARLNSHGNMGKTLRDFGEEMINDAKDRGYLA